jgi:glycosyltransferase involved in cell wall biosynthesis
MLLAYNMFNKSITNGNKFLVVGNRKWWTESMQQTLESMVFRDNVIFTGRVSDDDLNDLMGAALANVYVSTFEGFGIPIIEAFQSGVPVITSNATSMPEIAGDAALIVDPTDTGQIAQAMDRLMNSETLRNDMIAKGQERAKLFTWQRSADLLWESVLKATE